MVHATLAPHPSVRGRLVIVGDVHGCVVELAQLLKKVNFNRAQDRLVFVGDLVNKGPRSHQVFCVTFKASPVKASNRLPSLLCMHNCCALCSDLSTCCLCLPSMLPFMLIVFGCVASLHCRFEIWRLVPKSDMSTMHIMARNHTRRFQCLSSHI